MSIILMGKRELVALLNLSSWCPVMVERLFLAVPRGCLRFVIVVFPDHTHLLFLTVYSGLSGDVVMNFIADRQPTFFVYDLNAEGEFHEVANLYYTIEDERVAVVSLYFYFH